MDGLRAALLFLFAEHRRLLPSSALNFQIDLRLPLKSRQRFKRSLGALSRETISFPHHSRQGCLLDFRMKQGAGNSAWVLVEAPPPMPDIELHSHPQFSLFNRFTLLPLQVRTRGVAGAWRGRFRGTGLAFGPCLRATEGPGLERGQMPAGAVSLLCLPLAQRFRWVLALNLRESPQLF